MKSYVPWFYLVAATGSQLAYAVDGLEAYRQGSYSVAAQTLVNQSDKDPVANYYLGRMRLYGYGELKNDILALRYFEQAAEKGVLSAQLLLARYNLIQVKDPEKALFWFKKAAAAGDLSAQLYCAAAYINGYGSKESPDMGRRYFIDAAKRGDAIAQATLGEYFLESRDSRNKKLGLIWLNKSVEQGNPRAQLRLAELYLSGGVVARDDNKAYELLNKAVAQNYIPAMIKYGAIAAQQNDFEKARAWYTKAATANDTQAEMALANLYLDDKSSLYNPKTGFMWMLQAAQSGSSLAQEALSKMYQDGTGVAADQQLANLWQQKAKETAAHEAKINPGIEVSKWLSNGQSSNFEMQGYRLGGIFNAWQNPRALKENNYNPAPQMEEVTRAELYRPNFEMMQPKEIAISDYFDVIAPALNPDDQSGAFAFPRYPLDPQIEALLKNESLALTHSPRVSMVDEGLPYPTSSDPSQPFDYINQMMNGWQQQANYQAVLSQMYGKAILGESAAQFELGQLYHYGVIVAKNIPQAITYYKLAAQQQDVRAEYNLGILYLGGLTDPVDYQQGINWLMDAAFKGNVNAQYVLAHIYEKGFKDAAGNLVLQPNPQQAMSMYYLASSNHYGPAQYRLAEYLVKQQQGGLSVAAKNNRTKLIKRLYEGAVKEGVAEANLPLAFYYAMDEDKKKQAQALEVAKKEAKTGNSYAALLLGIMFERGIAVPANNVESMYWYQQAGSNSVNNFILGTYYTEGNGVSKDLQKGKALLQQSADAGFSYANLNLAVLKHDMGENFLSELDKARQSGNSTAGLLLADYYLSQAADPEKLQQARDIYQYFAEKGDKDAQLKLAFLYEKGLGGQPDTQLATQWYTASADQGQPVSQFLLGRMYQLGKIGNAPDYEQAKKWYSASQSSYSRSSVALGFIYDTVDDDYSLAFKNYELAAQKNDKIGQYNLALIYEDGKGMPVDYAKARALFGKAAELGHKQSMTQLAELYFNGLGGSRDEQQALHWYKKAAALGESDALYQLGLLSETGVATKLDFSNAVNYYQESANKGNDKAKLALARMYQYGLGVVKDSQKAVELYIELAANNNAYAQYQLALLYLDGAQKPEEGKKLLLQASANGSQQARKTLQWLDAQQQDRLSFIEPVMMNQMPILAGQSANLMYFDALNEWNRGDETLSRMILNRIMTQFPQYIPAKRAFEQLNQDINSPAPLNVSIAH
ncbi:tetratricopeptide repeat protein [Legionella hackeliae]|uniref:Enhanced entry protein EnhC-Beta-lactamase [Sel1-domain][Tetratricopeptide-like helical] n=1 Tax=Legionella hackeliae TaxID=449 RepID=A0A0A8UT00_LEGHA|nr:SEL1-like repeat protein [Legionella hackeliae]KTD10415.1 enhanced entry protein EnhC [Legionella hackeliae]CEK09914.1 Enhanced entry protein EnhC-Beta-lactamase [Sel1-domain][Tetratricopeptide-like helical] [Legionella hackeliae]STX49826.1 enhanced entry protein EnhC [Legionella hackeliae]